MPDELCVLIGFACQLLFVRQQYDNSCSTHMHAELMFYRIHMDLAEIAYTTDYTSFFLVCCIVMYATRRMNTLSGEASLPFYVCLHSQWGAGRIWITVRQGPTALAVGADGSCLDIFSLVCHFSFLSRSLWETARYRLKYCLKGPSSPKHQLTNNSQWGSTPKGKNAPLGGNFCTQRFQGFVIQGSKQ